MFILFKKASEFLLLEKTGRKQTTPLLLKQRGEFTG
jgi:hypothetical protein